MLGYRGIISARVRSTQSSVSSSCSLLTQRGSPPYERKYNNTETLAQWQTADKFSPNSALIFTIPNSFRGERHQGCGDTVAEKRGPRGNTICIADEKKINKSRGKIKQARTCSLEKCFNYIQKNVANKGGN